MSHDIELEESRIRVVFEHLGYLLTCGAIMAGGAAIAKYNEIITPNNPYLGITMALIIAFSGLGLAAWVVAHGLIKIGNIYNSKIKGLLYGGLYAFLGSSMAVALFMAATDA